MMKLLSKLFIVEVFAKNTPTDKHDANFIIQADDLKNIFIIKYFASKT